MTRCRAGRGGVPRHLLLDRGIQAGNLQLYMSSLKFGRPFSRLLVALFVSFLLMGEASGEDIAEDLDSAWDNDAVVKLATELEKTLRVAYENSLKAPPQSTVLQQRERDSAQGVIRKARNLSEDYARKMRAGWDRDASEPYFRAVVDEVAYVWESAGDAVPAESAQPLIDRLQELLDALQAYYDAAAVDG